MGRSKETFGKKEVRNKKLKKRKEKEKRRLEKKEQGKKSSFDDMIAWVDENGQITSTPPDLSNKKEIEAENIEIGIPKSGSKNKDSVLEGKITTFDESKGYGFINSPQLRDSVFVHVKDCIDEIQAGDKVTFETEKGLKGIKAIHVKRI
jgi:cold shock CspA family protein